MKALGIQVRPVRAAFGLALAGSLLAISSLGAVPARRPLSNFNFGNIVYDDTEFEMRPGVVMGVADAEAYVNLKVDTLIGTSANTLSRHIGYGSDILMYYDPNPAPGDRHHPGWRSLSPATIQTTPDPCYTRRLDRYLGDAKHLLVDPDLSDRFDPIRVAGERANQNGLYYFLTWRMNDPHNNAAGENNVVIGEFRANNFASSIDGLDGTTGDDASYLVNAKNAWDYYYDYANSTVRANRKALIFEFIDRYADLIDGITLDFQRQNIIFQPVLSSAGRSVANSDAAALTAWMEEIRAKLDEVSEAQGRPIFLSVRVPSTLRDCRWLGIYVDEWITSELVDIVVPVHIYENSHSIPLDSNDPANSSLGSWIGLANPSGGAKRALIYAGFLGNGGSYTGIRPFSFTPPSSYTTPEGAYDNIYSVLPLRGQITNYRHMQADGFELLNYQLYHPLGLPVDRHVKTLDILAEMAASPSTLRGRDKVFAVTNSRETPWQDSFYPSTLKHPLPFPAPYASSETSRSIPLVVREDLSTGPAPTHAALRLGVRPGLQAPVNNPDPTPDIPATYYTSINGAHTITVTLNGTTLYSGAIGSVMVQNYQPGTIPQDHPDDPVPPALEFEAGKFPPKSHYLQFTLSNPASILIQGTNIVEITLGNNPSTIRVTEINLGLSYN